MSSTEKRFAYLSLILSVVISAFLLIILWVLNSTMVNTELLDVRFYYSGAEAQAFLSKLSPSDVFIYRTIAGVDLFFIAAYTVATYYFFKINFPLRFLWFGFIPGVLDLLETSGILFVLANNTWPICFNYLGAVTAAKWIAVILSWVIILVFFVYKRLRPVRPPTTRSD